MTEKVKKPFYKKWWVWLIAIIVLIIIVPTGDNENAVTEEDPAAIEAVADTGESNQEEAEQDVVEAETEVKDENIPREYKSALKKAEMYATTMHMSKAGIYDQLTSEYGENFPPEAAQYAIDNIEHDWKANALKKAETYAEMMSMSDAAIYDQLISEYGEKFTPEEAQYAIDNLE